MNCYMPVRLFTGANCLIRNEEALRSLGDRCLIVCGKSGAESSGALGEAKAALSNRGVRFDVFDSVRENPTVQSCIEAGRAAHAFGARFILGIGGGSALDAAKAASVFAANSDLDEDGFYGKNWQNRPLPIALIGTTAGTGSEVTMVSVLTDKLGRKRSIHDERLYAAIAFSDSRYTLSLPVSLTLNTGIDALSHCAESYFSKKASYISRAYSLYGIRLLVPPLKCAARGELPDESAREDLCRGAILGGLAINLTGTCFPHNLGYYLTERYKIPHGPASAAFLSELLDHIEAAFPGEAAKFYGCAGTDACELRELIRAATAGINVFMEPDELEAVLPRWSDNGSVKNTQGDVTLFDIKRYFTKFTLKR